MEFLTHFGLQRNPFAMEADVRDYYQAAVPSRILVQIQGLIISEESRTITVTGGVGSGKSMVALKLTGSLSPDAYRCVLIRDFSVVRDEHIQMLLHSVFGGVVSGDDSLIRELRSSGVEPVLIIDGAERLSSAMRSVIDRLVEQFKIRLVEFSDGNGGDLVLDPWDSSAIARMIVSRIKAAGSQTPLYSRDALLSLVKSAAGIPGEAVALAALGLQGAWLAGREIVDESFEGISGGAGISPAPATAPTPTMSTPTGAQSVPAQEEMPESAPAIGIENPAPVHLSDEVASGYDLEETEVALDIGADVEEDELFARLAEEPAANGSGNEFESLAADLAEEQDIGLGSLDDLNSEDDGHNADSTLNDEFADLAADLDTEDDTTDDTENLKDEYDFSAFDNDLEGSSIVQGDGQSLEEEFSDLLDDDQGATPDAETASYSNSELDEGIGSLDFQMGNESPLDDASLDLSTELEGEASSPSIALDNADEEFDIDSEFESMLADDSAVDGGGNSVGDITLDDGSSLDDTFASLTEASDEVEDVSISLSAGDEDGDFDAMLADLNAEVGGESDLSSEQKPNTPIPDMVPAEAIDEDLEAELDELLQEFGDL